MFIDRNDAAKQLIAKLSSLPKTHDYVVLAIPRGGLAIGAAIARYLHAPLDVILAKKIGLPGEPELAIGAATLTASFVDPSYNTPALQPHITREIDRIRTLLHKRTEQYHTIRKPVPLQHKIVIIVDDGIATGHTMMAAIRQAQLQKPHHIIVAAPVIAQDTRTLFEKIGIATISIITPAHMMGIGQFYEQFPQVDDEEALHIMSNYVHIKDKA